MRGFIFFISALFLSVTFTGCNSSQKPNSATHIERHSTPVETAPTHPQTSKEPSRIPEKYLSIANSVLAGKGGFNTGTIFSVSPEDRWEKEGHFTSTETKDILLLIRGSASGSAGTAQNLLLLLSGKNDLEVIWAAQAGDVEAKDLNNDSILEIIETASSIWMGGCSEYYSIISFKKGLRKLLFEDLSHSSVNCGGDYLTSTYHKGDTVSVHSEIRLEELEDHHFRIRQAREIGIHQGGNSEAEVLGLLLVVKDTIYFTIH